MLTLHHAPQSRSTRILWVLEETGAPYDIVYTDIGRMDGSGGPDPANPHPDKKVPALVHDGALVTESIAVTIYAADLFPEAGLAPQIGDPARGPYLTWLAYYAGVIEPVVHFELFGLGDDENLRRTFRGRAEMERRVVGALETTPYIAGETFTAADIIIVTFAQFLRQMLPPGDPVDDYVARCTARPAYARSLARDAPPG